MKYTLTVFFAETLEMSIKQIDVLKEIVEKAGFQIFLEKTVYMSVDAKDSTWTMRTDYGYIK